MSKTTKSKSKAAGKDQNRRCPECGGYDVTTEPAKDTFTYGAGENAVCITATLPFRHCHDCDSQFLDYQGEDAMHEAVCRHLGVMSPAEIVHLRKRTGLSRQEFANLTKLGEATIARWERGAWIQNAANDQFLFLLGFPENVQRLRERSMKKNGMTPKASVRNHKKKVSAGLS